ncbi:cytochrome c oxidase subunit II [Sphingosinicella rhizophila]|uniref:Cytochrome c oxidase subunit 2 n=1 Tax=Sphingosinicella rhizophila TaxID=3050082 RepID=A0ABU3Q7X8_9SPHN|nr:cytochrome c oxidase subunit II [Sphingosinicella sp. GR2756]MDT9599402.1 cytochrome c oxidase subunit II [Sphingosinicella sp. GR2756]
MKTLLKLLAVAAAFGMAPAAVAAQTATTPAAAQPTAAPPSDAISARSQASPAQPEEVSDPAIANITGEEPSDATVAKSTMASQLPTPTYIGQPNGTMNIQDQVTPIGREAAWFHNVLLLPIITIISIFVLLLMIYVVVRFRRGAHPVPSRTTHNTALEVIWTLVPVLILVAIAIPSIQLLANQYSPPKADLTVKVTGNQWYWTYTYPDNGDFEIVSNMLSDADAKQRGEPRLLGVDERMVVPVGATVKVIVTASDVIHSWGVPAFWVKLDAVPGRLNETWFKAEKPGLYYGQCFELCGARHAYMPIAVEVVSQDQFAAWVASKGGTMPGAVAPTSVEATVNSPITNPGAAGSPVPTAGGAATETSPEPTNISAGTATPPVSSQAATDSRGNQ